MKERKEETMINPVDLSEVDRVRTLLDFAENHPDSLGSFIINFSGFHQYAAGITGVNRTSTLYKSKDGFSFASKEEALEAANQNGLKSFKRKGRKNEGYGSIGQEKYTLRILTIKKLIAEVKALRPNDYYAPVTLYSSLEKLRK